MFLRAALRNAPAAVLALALSVSSSSGAAAGVIFADNFDRPDGPVGNGWSASPVNVGGDLVIRDGALTTATPDGGSGVYRAVDYSGAVTASATITDHNGFGGLRDRFETLFLFGGAGDPASGYAVEFYRGDQNSANSAVSLFHDGLLVATALSTFQFSGAIIVSTTFTDQGLVSGSVSGGGQSFAFDFGDAGPGISGVSTFGIFQEGPGTPSPIFTHSAIDNFTLSQTLAEVPDVPTWLALISGFFAIGTVARRRQPALR